MDLQLARQLSVLALIALLAFMVNPLREAQSADSGTALRGAPIDAGDPAPDFTLLDQDGRPHTLSKERVSRDAVILIFYRGHW